MGTVRNHLLKLFEDFMFKLGSSPQKSHEVKLLMDKITNGVYGEGEGFPAFVGACAYVVMRKDQKMLPIVEVADVVGCDVYELVGRIISRADDTGMKLSELDIVDAFEHAIEMSPSFSEVPEDVFERMFKQGVFLVQCLVQWSLTTGRKPMPVAAAVLVFVGEMNQVDVKIDDVAMELHLAVAVCRLRYNELLQKLVVVVCVLPWGKDVTVMNIFKNAPCVIQYLEMKSMTKSCGERQGIEQFGCDMEGFVEDSLSKEIRYSFDSYNREDGSSNYFEVGHLLNLTNDNLDKLEVSPESLTMIYSSFLEEVSLVKATAEAEAGIDCKSRTTFDIQACTDWWRGKSDTSKKLILKLILETNVELDAMPPSFDRGCLSKTKRQEKIDAAKLSIQKIMHPKIADSGYSNDLCFFESEEPEKKRRTLQYFVGFACFR